MHWPPLLPPNSVAANTAASAGGGDGASSSFFLYPSLLSAKELEAVLDVLHQETPLNTAPDTVDSMAAWEFYWLSRTEPRLVRPSEATNALQLSRVLQPIVDARLTPLVNVRYREQCRGRCTPCTSLVRRYRPHERRSHSEHFDLFAIATTVIVLATAGEQMGGLYVSTGTDVHFLGLSPGDGVIHQSDLLHGVAIHDQEDDAATAEEDEWERWSWIVWYSDSTACEMGRPAQWNLRAAEAGEPLAAFLHARRLHLDPGLDRTEAARLRVRFLTLSAEAGFSRSMVELGDAHKAGKGVRADLRQAMRWWRRANATEHCADAAYKLGRALLDASQNRPVLEAIAPELTPEELADPIRAAVGLFFAATRRDAPPQSNHESGAVGGAPDASWRPQTLASESQKLACHHLGIAHAYGRSVPKDEDLAAYYFGRADRSESMRFAAQLHFQRGRSGAALRWMRRAANAGDEQAKELYPTLRRQLLEREEL